MHGKETDHILEYKYLGILVLSIIIYLVHISISYSLCFQVNEPYAFISSTLTFWAPVIAMLFMYRRIYKEAVRQREHIRRSSVPSQQHLIVDSDSNRLRFQALQANGFRRGCNTSKAPPALPNPPIPPIKAPLTPPNSNDIIRHHQKSNRKETRETIDPSNSQGSVCTYLKLNTFAYHISYFKMILPKHRNAKQNSMEPMLLM